MTDDFPHYHVNVFYSAEDECWIAAVPDLQNCNAHGDTPDEALQELRIAVGLWMDSWLEDHKELPPVRYRPPQPYPAAA